MIIIVIMGSVKFIPSFGYSWIATQIYYEHLDWQSIALVSQQSGRKFMQTFVSVGIFGLQCVCVGVHTWMSQHNSIVQTLFYRPEISASRWDSKSSFFSSSSAMHLFSLPQAKCCSDQIERTEFSCSAWFLV